MTDSSDRRVAQVRDWCRAADFSVTDRTPVHLQVTLDRGSDLVVEVAVGDEVEPLRIHDRFAVSEQAADGLVEGVIEAVVLGRSSMIDARLAPQGLVETVVAVYPDGISRHTFMTAVFEIQKVRDLIRRGVEDGTADADAVAELERLLAADTGTPSGP